MSTRPPLSEASLLRHVYVRGVGKGTYRELADAGITSVADWLSAYTPDLLALKVLGPHKVRLIDATLKAHGLGHRAQRGFVQPDALYVYSGVITPKLRRTMHWVAPVPTGRPASAALCGTNVLAPRMTGHVPPGHTLCGSCALVVLLEYRRRDRG